MIAGVCYCPQLRSVSFPIIKLSEPAPLRVILCFTSTPSQEQSLQQLLPPHLPRPRQGPIQLVQGLLDLACCLKLCLLMFCPYAHTHTLVGFLFATTSPSCSRSGPLVLLTWCQPGSGALTQGGEGWSQKCTKPLCLHSPPPPDTHTHIFGVDEGDVFAAKVFHPIIHHIHQGSLPLVFPIKPCRLGETAS